MKRLISNKKTDAKSKKKKPSQSIQSLLEIDYVILDQCNIYKPKNNILRFSLACVKFDSSNIFVRGKPVKLFQKDIKLLSYCLENSLICLTLTSECYNYLFPLVLSEMCPENSIWFCVTSVELSEFLATCKLLSKNYSWLYPIEPLSAEIYQAFRSNFCPTVDSFVTDWSVVIVESVLSNETKLTYEDDSNNKLNYSPSNRDGVEVLLIDLLCLRSEQCLNDNIINFYLIYIYHEIITDDQRERSYFFNVFFNTKLIGSAEQQRSDSAAIRHARVAKWTKSVDIFTKDFLIIPIIEDTHWFLIIVCFPWMVGMVDYCKIYDNVESRIPANHSQFATESRGQRLAQLKQRTGTNPMPCILLFDSMAHNSRTSKVKIIREYLKSEWDSKRAVTDGSLVFDKRTCRGYGPKVPQQGNHYDCGIYLLHYVESFFKEPFVDFSLKFFEIRLLSWFDDNGVRDKRRQIKAIIMKKFKSSETRKSKDKDGPSSTTMIL